MILLPLICLGKLITYSMWRNIFGQSIYQCIVLFVLLFATGTESISRPTHIRCLTQIIDGDYHLVLPNVPDGVQANENHQASLYIISILFCTERTPQGFQPLFNDFQHVCVDANLQ